MSTPLITRIGLVTALGATAVHTWEALLAGQFLLDHSKIAIPVPPGGSRVLELARGAIHDAGISNRIAPETALILGTSKGPVEKWLATPPPHMSDSAYESVGGLGGRGVPHLLSRQEYGGDAGATLHSRSVPGGWGLSEIASQIAGDLGMTGPRLTICAACASGLHALIRGAMLIRSGEARRVLVIAAEASIHPLFLASFARLGVLPKPGGGMPPVRRNPKWLPDERRRRRGPTGGDGGRGNERRSANARRRGSLRARQRRHAHHRRRSGWQGAAAIARQNAPRGGC